MDTSAENKSASGHPVVSREEWLGKRIELLQKEKELTRFRDDLSRQLRELPWVQIEKEYVFSGSDGDRTLTDLFGGNSQLIVQHFMFGPGWKEGCVGCSFLSDYADSANLHLKHHDVSLVAVSRAPWEEIAPFKQRMGWEFPWFSSSGSDFNYDFHASFTPQERAAGKAFCNYSHGDPGIDEIGGHSVFFKDADGQVFHTYSTFCRGDEILLGAYNYLDRTPLGRNENGERGDLGDWVRHHDRYGVIGQMDDSGRFHEESGCCPEREKP